MLKSLKNITNSLSPDARKQAKELQTAQSEAISIIESEVNRISAELDQLSPTRPPGIKFAKAQQNLRSRIDLILSPFGQDCDSLAEAKQLHLLDRSIRLATLQRYTQLIPTSDSITPFATFREIFKARDGEAFAQDEAIETAYQLAARSLFTHPQLEATLLDRMDKKIKILGESTASDDTQERRQIKTLISHYGLCKKHQPSLANNPQLEAKIAEIEAVLFFQDQILVLETGEHAPTAELSEYINHWMIYLNELSAEEQVKRSVLIQVADHCSQLNNASL